jgi:hypothetical protein
MRGAVQVIPVRWKDLEQGDSVIQRAPVMKVERMIPAEERAAWDIQPTRGTQGQAWTLVTRVAPREKNAS